MAGLSAGAGPASTSRANARGGVIEHRSRFGRIWRDYSQGLAEYAKHAVVGRRWLGPVAKRGDKLWEGHAKVLTSGIGKSNVGLGFGSA